MKVGDKTFAAWEKSFPAGEVGLGVNSLKGGGEHYFVALRPQTPGATLTVDHLYPGQLRLGVLQVGEKPFVDRDETLKEVPLAWPGRF